MNQDLRILKHKTMKTRILILIPALLIANSCKDLSEFNQDIKNPQTVPAGALFANATISLFNFMTSANVNTNNFRLWAQQWAQTTYADESNYDLVTRNINGAAWNTFYATILRDLSEAKKSIEEDAFLDAGQKQVQTAMAEVLEVFSYHVLVDLFGDVPYNEALTDDVTPAYDDDAAIYADIMSRLDAAISVLGGDSGMGTYDVVYGGNADLWRKFANSLKLRLAIRLADVNSSVSKTKAEEAVADGVFTSNDENFMLNYQSSTPNTNPLWVDLIQSGRSDFVAASTLVDPMVDLNDPRLPFYFRDTFGTPSEFVGGVYGDNNAYNQFSHPGELQETPTFPGIVMSYWEVQFLLADAAQRGYNVGGTAAEFYNEGITASILYWGGTAAEATAYLSNPDVAFATATGTPLQRIAFQKWISLYDQGFEAWSTYRLYDYPPMPAAVLTGMDTPTRYTYPVTEYSLNEQNVNAARSSIGSDALTTKVFWDVN
jgi:hypothetical protein